MTVKELKTALEKFDEDKMVVIADSDNIWWDNIDSIIEKGSEIRITTNGAPAFQD